MWLCWVVTTSRITISCDNPPPVSWVSLFSCCLCSAGAEWRVVSWMSCTWARCTLSINTSLVPQPICLGKIPLPPPSRPGNSCGSFSRADLSLPQLTYFPLCKFIFFVAVFRLWTGLWHSARIPLNTLLSTSIFFLLWSNRVRRPKPTMSVSH